MEDKVYTFIHVPDKTCKTLEDFDIREYLMKWSMKGNLQVQYYSFNQPFQLHTRDQFVDSFFKDPAVFSTLVYNQLPVGKPAGSVTFQAIPCTVISMDFFDSLTTPEKGIVRCDGKTIVQCQEEEFEGFLIDDNLRNVILNEESEFYCLFSESDRKQFLWRLFSHLCLGGEWCQFEFSLEPYLSVVRRLYKELVSVERVGDTTELVIRSVVLRVLVFDPDGNPLLPHKPDNTQNFVYLIIDPFKRSVIVLSHMYGGNFCI